MANETEDKNLTRDSGNATKNTMTAMDKKYPDTVVVKKSLIMFAIFVAVILCGVIFTNVVRSTSAPKVETKPKDSAQVTNTQGGSRPTWDQNMQVRKYSVSNITQQGGNAVKQGQTNTISTQTQSIANKTNGVNKPQVVVDKAADDEMKKILSAPINSNQINFEIGSNSNSVSTPNASIPVNSNVEDKNDPNDQNRQTEKKAFVKVSTETSDDYLHETLKNPISPYEVKAGTIIPAILISGINSDLPGQITAQVRSNIYDTVAGKHLLIPQGARLTGLYDSQITYGQERVLVVWKRIIFPNGQSINLEGMPGVDMSGYAGFNDQVNNHYVKIFGSVILMSVISAGAQLSQPQNNNNNFNSNPTVNQALAASLGTNIMNAANTMLQKNINVQPTLVIRPGYLMNISVTKDMVFPKDYAEGTTYDD